MLTSEKAIYMVRVPMATGWRSGKDISMLEPRGQQTGNPGSLEIGVASAAKARPEAEATIGIGLAIGWGP